MRQDIRKRLQLSRQTMRNLDRPEQQGIEGGAGCSPYLSLTGPNNPYPTANMCPQTSAPTGGATMLCTVQLPGE